MSKPYQAPLNWYTGGADTDVEETEEWLTAFEQVIAIEGRERACFLLKKLPEKGYEKDVTLPFTGNTPYINTIPVSRQPAYGGDRAIERRIKSIVRWNAMAMVVRANKHYAGLGGHISTFASSATLYQVGMHHFFHGRGAFATRARAGFQGRSRTGVPPDRGAELRLRPRHSHHDRGPSRADEPAARLAGRRRGAGARDVRQPRSAGLA